MFGHTLLRFDSTQPPLLAYAVNYAAEVPAGEGLAFPVKGLSGGYRGRFSVMPSYLKLREYQHIERREMWEYHLNLTPDEVRRVVDHIWELRDVSFPYYFLNDNCAAKLLDVLQVARPELAELHQRDSVVVPQDILKSLQKTGLIDAVHQITLSADRIPASQLDNGTPSSGHDTRAFDVLPGRFRQGSARRDMVDFRLRAGYHDLNDPLPGYPAGSGIEFLGLDLRASPSAIQLREATLVRVRALGAAEAGMLSPVWQGALLLSREHLPNALHRDALALQAHLGVGAAIRMGNFSLYSLLESRIGARQQDAVAGIGPVLGVLYQRASGGALAASFSHQVYLPDRQDVRIAALTASLPLNPALSVLAEASRSSGDGFQAATRMMLGVRHYF